MHEPLDRWLDPRVACEAFAGDVAACLGGTPEPAHLRLLDVHYKTYLKPGATHRASLGVTWAMRLPGMRSAGAVGDTPSDTSRAILHARFFRPGALPAAENATVTLSAHDALVWVHPADPLLAHLGAATAPDAMREHLPRHLAGARVIDADVVNYRPAQRCTTRFHLVATATDGTLVRVFAKTFDGPARRMVFDRLLALRAATAAADCPLALPEPIGHDDALHTMWVHGVAGPELAACIGTADEYLHLDRAAAALAALHATSLDGLPVCDRRMLLDEADKKVAKLAHVHPVLAPRLGRIQARMHALAEEIPAAPPAVIHGDCHAGQWIASRRRITLVDLDELALGEPAQDIGNFAADIACRSLDRATEARVIRTFRDRCARHAADACDPRAVDWHFALQLLNKAHRHHVQRRWRAAADFGPALARIARAIGCDEAAERVEFLEPLEPVEPVASGAAGAAA